MIVQGPLKSSNISENKRLGAIYLRGGLHRDIVKHPLTSSIHVGAMKGEEKDMMARELSEELHRNDGLNGGKWPRLDTQTHSSGTVSVLVTIIGSQFNGVVVTSLLQRHRIPSKMKSCL